MNDAEFEKQKARIEAIIERWTKPLGIDHLQKFVVNYHRDNSVLEAHDCAGAFGMTISHWQYKRAYIDFDLSQAEEQDDADLEYAVVHELVHVLLSAIEVAFADDNGMVPGIAKEHVERTTTEIAVALLTVRDGGAKK